MQPLAGRREVSWSVVDGLSLAEAMRILVVSNFFPPHHFAGYELGCRDVVEGLRERGHEVQVLTSTYGVGRGCDEGNVSRRLLVRISHPTGHLDRWAWALRSEIANQAEMRRAVANYRPELIYVWNVGCTSLSVAIQAEKSARPVVYYVSDQWPVQWDYDFGHFMFNTRRGVVGRVQRSVARGMLRLAGAAIPFSRPQLSYPQFTSGFIRDRVMSAGFTPLQSWVIPWGVDLDRFPTGSIRWPATRLIYAGQVAHHKGVHTAVAAFLKVAATPEGAGITLTIAGGAVLDPGYMERLQATVAAADMASRVQFLGQVSREQLAGLYREHDIFLFPSEFNEPFSIALVEAMAVGLAIIATQTGGTPEIARHGENALTFRGGDVVDCTLQLHRLLADRNLYESLRRRAAQTAQLNYGFARMIDQVEESLRTVLATNITRNTADC